MPRGQLSEKYIQRAGIDWLAQELGRQSETCAVVKRAEVRLNRHVSRQNGRADGLVAALRSDGTVFTASLEAKSTKTIRNLRFSYSDWKWAIHIGIVGAICLILGVYLSQFSAAWYWRWGIPTVLALLGMFIFILLTHSHIYYRKTDVLSQARKYPANEKWIAFSADVFNRLSLEQQQILQNDCLIHNIGLLSISAGPKVRCIHRANQQPIVQTGGNHLESYAAGGAIYVELEQIAKAKTQQIPIL